MKVSIMEQPFDFRGPASSRRLTHNGNIIPKHRMTIQLFLTFLNTVSYSLSSLPQREHKSPFPPGTLCVRWSRRKPTYSLGALSLPLGNKMEGLAYSLFYQNSLLLCSSPYCRNSNTLFLHSGIALIYTK